MEIFQIDLTFSILIWPYVLSVDNRWPFFLFGQLHEISMTLNAVESVFGIARSQERLLKLR